MDCVTDSLTSIREESDPICIKIPTEAVNISTVHFMLNRLQFYYHNLNMLTYPILLVFKQLRYLMIKVNLQMFSYITSAFAHQILLQEKYQYLFERDLLV